jgi:hypothetical protein
MAPVQQEDAIALLKPMEFIDAPAPPCYTLFLLSPSNTSD